MWVTHYEQATGRILGSEYNSSADGYNIGLCALQGYYDPELFYYDCLAKKVQRRPMMDIKVSGNTITGLPSPCAVSIRRDNQVYQVDDGQFTYETPLSGENEVSVCAFPYIDWKGVLCIEN